jgi:hypothetical protein
MEESERTEGMKVTDKRRFTKEGETKEGETSAAGDQPQAESSHAAPEEESPQEPREKPTGHGEPPPPIDFSALVLSLANTALFQLGLIKASESDPVEKDFRGAKQTIDIIALLEEKTRGNLTEQEKMLISETLFQLRMAFVESSK